ncbi:MAG: bifunctional aspartate kinase/diaminopimelate decarboxylase, partial [Rhodanobacteraceae bacterium]
MIDSTIAPLPPDAPWIVLKFGGTSVASVERWRTIVDLAAARRAEGARVLVVVSALAGVTDALKALCACAPGERATPLEDLHECHRALLARMELPRCDGMERWLESLGALLVEAGVDSGPSPRGRYSWQAQIQAHGELLSSALGADFMSANGLRTEWLDAREVLPAREVPFANERSRVLSAQVDAQHDPAFAARLDPRGEVFITQGFIGRDANGNTVLLGRGGSDTSA